MLKREPTLLRLADKLLPLAAKVPFVVQRLALQQALNHCLAEPLRAGEFEPLRERWLRLQVRDLGLAWCVSLGRKGLLIAQDAPAEVTISGNWREFLLLASRQEDPDTLFFRRRLLIEGDTELGLEVKNLIDSLDSDLLPPWLWRNLERAGKGLAAVSA